MGILTSKEEIKRKIAEERKQICTQKIKLNYEIMTLEMIQKQQMQRWVKSDNEDLGEIKNTRAYIRAKRSAMKRLDERLASVDAMNDTMEKEAHVKQSLKMSNHVDSLIKPKKMIKNVTKYSRNQMKLDANVSLLDDAIAGASGGNYDDDLEETELLEQMRHLRKIERLNSMPIKQNRDSDVGNVLNNLTDEK